MMDIEKLRKSLLENSDPDGPCIEDDLMQAAATALSTLQAENEKLRDELKAVREEAQQFAGRQSVLVVLCTPAGRPSC